MTVNIASVLYFHFFFGTAGGSSLLPTLIPSILFFITATLIPSI